MASQVVHTLPLEGSDRVSNASSSEKNEKQPELLGSTVIVPVKTQDLGLHVSARGADAAAALAAKFNGQPVSEDECKRVLRKIDWHLMPMMMLLYCVQFMDKTTLGSSAVLGLKKSTHLTTTEYNLLGTLFYVSYLAFEWPQNLALQRFPVGKWLSLNVTIWAIVLTCMAATHNFASLAVLRLLLGMCEGSITAGYMIVTGMFYTKTEQARRVGFWFLMNGTAQIFNGLFAWAVHQAKHPKLEAWRAFYLLTGGITFLTALVFWLFFPDSPVTARFLTEHERYVAIERIKVNQQGTETKQWKKSQFIEAFCDWKLYVFAVFAALNNVPNSLTNQNTLIIQSFGFSVDRTVLLGMVGGAVEIITIYASTIALKFFPNQRAYIGAIWLVPNVLGSILVVTLPWSNKGGLLAALWVTGVGTPGFVIALSWINSSVAGHTKKTTTNAAFLIGYCLGNLLSPLMWLERYKPRNYIPWAIIAVCYFLCAVIILFVRYMFAKENQRRDELQAAQGIDPAADEWGYIDETMPDGTVVTHRVEKAFMDLTDKENLSFRYPL